MRGLCVPAIRIAIFIAVFVAAGGTLAACGTKDDGTYPCCTSKMEYWVCPDATTFDLCERVGTTASCTRDTSKDSLCLFDR